MVFFIVDAKLLLWLFFLNWLIIIVWIQAQFSNISVCNHYFTFLPRKVRWRKEEMSNFIMFTQYVGHEEWMKCVSDKTQSSWREYERKCSVPKCQVAAWLPSPLSTYASVFLAWVRHPLWSWVQWNKGQKCFHTNGVYLSSHKSGNANEWRDNWQPTWPCYQQDWALSSGGLVTRAGHTPVTLKTTILFQSAELWSTISRTDFF